MGFIRDLYPYKDMSDIRKSRHQIRDCLKGRKWTYTFSFSLVHLRLSTKPQISVTMWLRRTSTAGLWPTPIKGTFWTSTSASASPCRIAPTTASTGTPSPIAPSPVCCWITSRRPGGWSCVIRWGPWVRRKADVSFSLVIKTYRFGTRIH